MHKKSPTAFVVGAIAALMIYSANGATAGADSNSSPALSLHLAALEFMIGTWTVIEVLEAGPMGPAGKGKGEMVATVGPGGHSIVLDYRSVDGPMAGFLMHQILTFEIDKDHFQQAYVTNRSQGLELAKGAKTETGFVFERRMERNGKVFISRGTIQEISKGSFAMESHMGVEGGEANRIMRLEYSRAP